MLESKTYIIDDILNDLHNDYRTMYRYNYGSRMFESLPEYVIQVPGFGVQESEAQYAYADKETAKDASKKKNNNSKNNDKLDKSMMLPKQLWDFCSAMQSKVASAKLYKKLYELAKDANKNTVFVTKIGYYVEKDTRIPYLVVSDMNGKESFSSMSGDIETFANNAKDNPYKVYLFKLDNELTPKEFELLQKYNDYCQKKISKDEAKSLVSTRYKIGDILMLKSKIRNGSKKNYKKFEVKKIIWSINANPVNVLILKQISGQVTNMSMSKNDCKRYHIKYEENLQVYSMMMNFIKINK